MGDLILNLDKIKQEFGRTGNAAQFKIHSHLNMKAELLQKEISAFPLFILGTNLLIAVSNLGIAILGSLFLN